MAYARHQRATHRPPNAASMHGMRDALAVLYGPLAPTPDDVRLQQLRALELAPYRKRQHELVLVLPEPGHR